MLVLIVVFFIFNIYVFYVYEDVEDVESGIIEDITFIGIAIAILAYNDDVYLSSTYNISGGIIANPYGLAIGNLFRVGDGANIGIYMAFICKHYYRFIIMAIIIIIVIFLITLF